MATSCIFGFTLRRINRMTDETTKQLSFERNRLCSHFTMLAQTVLLYLLLQITEQFGIEKVLDGDAQPVAELLDCGNRCAVVAAADDIVDCGLRDAAHAAELIDRDAMFMAQFQNPFFDSLPDVQGYHLASIKNDTRSILKRLTLLS